VYRLTQPDEHALYYDALLTRGLTCSLDVSWRYGVAAEEHNRRLEGLLSRSAEAAAQLLMQGSAAVPILPAARIDTLRPGERLGARA
jgi:hypothetical protein